MKLKKILAVVSSLIMFTAFTSNENFNIYNEFIVSASTEEVTFPNLYYEINGDLTGITIADCDEIVTEVEIPAEIDGLPVVCIEWSAFSHCTLLTSVIIPDSVTKIRHYAFYNCTSLTEVTIPNSVVDIGTAIFCDCTSLKSVTIPSSITYISFEMFSGCTSLTDVYFQGTEEEWNSIQIGDGNECLLNATIHFSDGTVINEKTIEGDIDSDGETTSNDALNILQIVANTGEFTEEQKARADLDGDGEVTALDALKLLYMIVGLE